MSIGLRWLPNAISVFRIALVWPVVSAVLNADYPVALALFMVAGASDAIDGFLAKRFDWRTRIGALLDPIADKLLMISTYLALAWVAAIPAWLAAAVVTRDVVIIGGAAAYNYLIAPVPGEPTRISKINTALELLFVLAVLSRAASGWPGELPVLLLGAAVLVTVVISGADYVLGWSARAITAKRQGDSLHDS